MSEDVFIPEFGASIRVRPMTPEQVAAWRRVEDNGRELARSVERLGETMRALAAKGGLRKWRGLAHYTAAYERGTLAGRGRRRRRAR